MHLTLPAKLLGDYLVYRTGLAGKLPAFNLPPTLARAWDWARILAGLLLLPAVGYAAALALGRWGMRPALAIPLASALAVGLYAAMRHFSRAWVCVDTYDVGSAGRLTGRCAVFQVFFGRSWDAAERDRCRRSVRTACDWLVARAAEHEISLELNLDPAEALALEDASGVSALRRPDFGRAYRYQEDLLREEIERLRPRWAQMVRERVEKLPASPDHVCLIVHVSARDTGFAMPARNDLHAESGLELCVCGWGSDPAVYAHELLHLFGAFDLYLHPWTILTRRGEQDDAIGQIEWQLVESAFEVFNVCFRNSIMGGVLPGIEHLTIDPLTARAIGWRRADGPFMQTAARRERAIGEALVDAFGKSDTPDEA